MNHFKLQFITHFTDTYSYLDSARMALEGGCRWVQFRMKHATDEETEAVAVEVQKLCRTYGATFLIDDRVELVRKLKLMMRSEHFLRVLLTMVLRYIGVIWEQSKTSMVF